MLQDALQKCRRLLLLLAHSWRRRQCETGAAAQSTRRSSSRGDKWLQSGLEPSTGQLAPVTVAGSWSSASRRAGKDLGWPTPGTGGSEAAELPATLQSARATCLKQPQEEQHCVSSHFQASAEPAGTHKSLSGNPKMIHFDLIGSDIFVV